MTASTLRTSAWALALAALLALAPALAAATTLRIVWIDERPDDAILTPAALLAFHDGQVDWFDPDRPAPQLLGRVLADLLRSRPYSIQEALRVELAPVEFRGFLGHPNADGDFSPPLPRWTRLNSAVLSIDANVHRYLSWLMVVQPGNDAFVGNEDPLRHRLFDDDGRFLGPFYIDVYGSEVQDAGLCANTETGLAWLDLSGQQPQACTDGEGAVRAHPGLNGSLRNPDGAPQRVLGATSTYSTNIVHRFDAEAADFSRAGQRLGRLLVSRVTGWVDQSGSWYSPARAGEGFSLQVLPPEPGEAARALVYWYTYAPDGSGRQVWLTGLAPIGGAIVPEVVIDLHRTEGGRFAATTNPATVVNRPWGRLRLYFDRCDRAQVAYESIDPAFGSGSFPIHRLGPPIEGLGWLCAGHPFGNPPPP
jgi:hypothetical protein